ncbi:MAG: MATE family efflux transporter [Synergistaceae bacterium]|nr:MATE family efflux transporter [Synergistaceae bacterium]
MISVSEKQTRNYFKKVLSFFSGKADLGKDRPMTAIIKLAIPSMGLFVFNGLLHLVDTVYVSWLGETQMAAMSFTAPVNIFIFALLECVGSGAASLMGQHLGRSDVDSARKISYSALALLYFVFCLSTPLIIPSVSNSLFTAIGAGESQTLLDLCWRYNMWMPLMLPFMGFTYIGNSVFRVQGNTLTPFKAIALANTINLVLDPIMIFTFGWGISGAAIATLISRIGSTYYLSLKMRKDSQIIINPFLKIKSELTLYWKRILWIGVPIAFSTASVALGMGSINKILSTFGHRMVSSWMLGSRVEELAFNFIMGINVSFMPYVAFNYGKRDFERIKNGFKAAYLLGFILMCSMSVVLYIYPHIILMLFDPLPEIEEMAIRAIRASIPSYPFVIFMFLSTGFFVGIGNSIYGTITQLFRSVIFRISAAWFYAKYFDVAHIWWFQSTSNIGGSLVAAVFFVYLMKRIKIDFGEKKSEVHNSS